jgi:hypothetical protein
MCDPATAIELGGAASAGSSVLGGQAQAAGYSKSADQLVLEARQRAAAIRRLAKETLSSATADYAASGVDVGSGSPRVAAQYISHNAEVDALNAMASGEAAAASARKSARAASNSGLLNAAGSALGAYGAFLALA